MKFLSLYCTGFTPCILPYIGPTEVIIGELKSIANLFFYHDNMALLRGCGSSGGFSYTPDCCGNYSVNLQKTE